MDKFTSSLAEAQGKRKLIMRKLVDKFTSSLAEHKEKET